MTYHTNHSWCSKSIYNGEPFHSEVMVYFGEELETDFIDDNFDYQKNEIFEDLDFERLTDKRKFFNQNEYDRFMKKNKDHEMYREFYEKDSITLKKEVIDWLNENIKDNLNTDKNTPENERKAWAIGNNEYNSNQPYMINIFFARQLDALKFIERWSIYEKPTFYFDYFHDDRREMNIKDIVSKTNEYRQSIGLSDINIGDKINIPHKISTDLNQDTFTLIDWETDFED